MSSNPKEPVKLWPRTAVGPLGNSARFYGPGDIPHGWKLDPPLPGDEDDEADEVVTRPATRRKPGRPPKAKAGDEHPAS